MNIALVFAGGVGTRMNSRSLPKQFLSVHGKPIIIHTLEHFENHPDVDAIVVSCVEGWIPYLEELQDKFKITKIRKIVPGGATGQLSIYNGLCAAEEVAADTKNIVLIHDGVRPLINSDIISKNIASVKKYGSAITSVKLTETALSISDEDPSQIGQIYDRSKMCFARAPQSFWLEDILAAHRHVMAENRTDFIDSCSMMSYMGHSLHLVAGPTENIKITMPEDFFVLRAMLDAKEDMQMNRITEG